MISTTVNGKPSWISGDYAIWFRQSGIWIIGNLNQIGQNSAWMYAHKDITELIANENHWKWYTEHGWELAPNDISVSCQGTFSNFSCM